MKIMGHRIEQPVQWTITNVLGVAGTVYLALNQPLGELPGYFQSIIWVLLGLISVRVVALIILLVARIMKVEEN